MKRPTARGERLDRETLRGHHSRADVPAADAAEGILDWAERDPRLDTRYTRTRVVIETAGRRLLKFSLTRTAHTDRGGAPTLANHGERWDDERIERFVQDFADIGVRLQPHERRWPKAPLEPLADDTRRHQFLTLIEQALDALTGSP